MESLTEETKLLKEKNEELQKEMVEIKALTTTLYNVIMICYDLALYLLIALTIIVIV